jgi:hypothetical protein
MLIEGLNWKDCGGNFEAIENEPWWSLGHVLKVDSGYTVPILVLSRVLHFKKILRAAAHCIFSVDEGKVIRECETCSVVNCHHYLTGSILLDQNSIILLHRSNIFSSITQRFKLS